jgi:hypothetical protein
VWVRLKSLQHIGVNGKLVTFHPGEWVQVGKQQANAWLTTGAADRPDMPDMRVLADCGVVVSGNAAKVKSLLPGLDVAEGEPYLQFNKTLLWDSAVNLRPELIVSGFNFLDTWEIASPIGSYEVLARDIGSEADRMRTETVIRDLRVPWYECRVLFLRQCRATRELLEAWRVEREAGDDRLAFLRALYSTKPLILALPATWIG